MPDAVDEAIRATEAQPKTHIGADVRIESSGRVAKVMVPVGITPMEMAELTGWMWMQLMPAAQQVPPERPVAVLDTPRGPRPVLRSV